MQTTRRKAIVGIGAVAIGTIGTALHTENAEAVSVSMGSLEIPDTTHTGEITEVLVSVESDIDWEASQDVTSATLTISAGDGVNDPTEIGTNTLDEVSNQSGSHTTTIEADVLDSATLGVGDFELLVGQPRRDVDVEIKLTVELESNGTVIASDSVTDMSVVTISESTAEISIAAEGELTVN